MDREVFDGALTRSASQSSEVGDSSGQVFKPARFPRAEETAVGKVDNGRCERAKGAGSVPPRSSSVSTDRENRFMPIHAALVEHGLEEESRVSDAVTGSDFSPLFG